MCSLFFFEVYGDHRDLHVLTHSFPTRRSSDLPTSPCGPRKAGGKICGAITANKAETPAPSSTISANKAVPLPQPRSEEHTSELQSLMRISYAVFCLKQKTQTHLTPHKHTTNTTYTLQTHHQPTPNISKQ